MAAADMSVSPRCPSTHFNVSLKTYSESCHIIINNFQQLVNMVVRNPSPQRTYMSLLHTELDPMLDLQGDASWLLSKA